MGAQDRSSQARAPKGQKGPAPRRGFSRQRACCSGEREGSGPIDDIASAGRGASRIALDRELLLRVGALSHEMLFEEFKAGRPFGLSELSMNKHIERVKLARIDLEPMRYALGLERFGETPRVGEEGIFGPHGNEEGRQLP